MDEKDLFNKDSMYWREVNVSMVGATAKVELNAPVEVNEVWVSRLDCILFPFQSHDVEYEMENGGAFKKTEVRAWPYVLLKDAEQYQAKTNDKLVHLLDHDHVQSIELKDQKGNVILNKAKI